MTDTNTKEFWSVEVLADEKIDTPQIEKYIGKYVKVKLSQKNTSSNEKTSYTIYFEFDADYIEDLFKAKNDKNQSNPNITITKISPSENFKEEYEKLLKDYKSLDTDTITFGFDYNNVLDTYFKRVNGQSGFELTNKEILSTQRGAFPYVLKQISKNILKGKFTFAYALPIFVFDSRTTMELFAWNLQLIPARIAGCEKMDTIERIKQLTLFLIIMNRINIPISNPLMPTIGDTYQCKINDIECYLETTRSNPPTFNFYIKNKDIIVDGYWFLVQQQGANSIANDSGGKFHVKFLSDGEEFEFTLCEFSITGLLFGSYLISLRNNVTVTHKKSKTISCINFNQPVGMLNGWFGKSVSVPDYLDGFIAKEDDVIFDEKSKYYSLKKDAKPEGKWSGEWSECIKYNDEKIWTKEQMNELVTMKKMDFMLPSSTIYRPDVLFIRNKSKLAEQAKVWVDESDRGDALLRKSNEDKK